MLQPTHRLFVRLEQPYIRAVVELAQLERRSPQDQGALLLEEALRARGALPTEDTNLTTTEPRAAANAAARA